MFYTASSPLPGLSLPLPSPQLLTSQFRVQQASTHHNVPLFQRFTMLFSCRCTFVDSHKSSKYGIAMTIRSDRGTVQLNQRKSLTSTPITAPTRVVNVTKTIIDKPTIVAKVTDTASSRKHVIAGMQPEPGQHWAWTDDVTCDTQRARMRVLVAQLLNARTTNLTTSSANTRL